MVYFQRLLFFVLPGPPKLRLLKKKKNEKATPLGEAFRPHGNQAMVTDDLENKTSASLCFAHKPSAVLNEDSYPNTAMASIPTVLPRHYLPSAENRL